ncbi:secreted RxLR effector protein 161-like [Nicotiana tabacum]|uniref:Secreted RxLR effector protein 161-like n=1 Tax=Nicotiana tabacum TaxID=4097 RepID=A0AC58U1V6_TOBAC
MGELNFFLGLQVKQTSKGTMISQQKYIKEFLKRFEMENSKTIDTPIATATRLDIDERGSHVKETMYRGIISSLLYLISSRPNIVFSVGLCARFQSSLKESHLKTAKRILRYLKGTQDLVLYYHLGDNFDLIGYVDVDYAGYLVDRKSTSGMAHSLGPCLISWVTKKQNYVALSTAEAEYVAATSCCAQLMWIKKKLEDFGMFHDCVPLLCDNTSALNMIKNLVQQKRTKHIDV